MIENKWQKDQKVGIRSIPKIRFDQNQECQSTEFKISSLKKGGIPFCYFDKKNNLTKPRKNLEKYLKLFYFEKVVLKKIILYYKFIKKFKKFFFLEIHFYTLCETKRKYKIIPTVPQANQNRGCFLGSLLGILEPILSKKLNNLLTTRLI